MLTALKGIATSGDPRLGWQVLSVDLPLKRYPPPEEIETTLREAEDKVKRLASDPACADKAGYHAIVLPPQSWLGLRHGATTVTDDWGMIAEVRWSRERVCLEALELSDSPFSHSDEETPR